MIIRTAAAALLLSAACVQAAPASIALPAPDQSLAMPLMQALAQRHSTRTFDSREVAARDIASLAWAGVGVNRPDGRRTAPTAQNRQEVDLFVVTAKGAWRYDAARHSLEGMSDQDLRPLVGARQAFPRTAPLCLVLAADLAKLPQRATTLQTGAVDVGIATQNLLLHCTAAGLSCVPRATMDAEGLRKALGMPDTQIPMMNVVVGYPAKAQ